MDSKMNNRVLVVDVEATGLDPSRHSLIEIGAVLLDENLKSIKEYSSLVAPLPGREINKESMAVNKISMEELKTAPDYKKVIEEFHEAFCLDPIVPTISGWNVWFDADFMRVLYDKVEKKWPFGHRFLDLQSVAQFFSGFRGVSLEKLVGHYIKEKPTHRAIDDARHTAQILRVLAEKYLPADSLLG